MTEENDTRAGWRGPYRSLRRTVQAERKRLTQIILIFTALGVALALISPVEYRSEVQLMPELPGKSAVNFQQFGAFAEMMGLDLHHSGTLDAVRPDLYPNVVQSTPFVLSLAGRSFSDRNNNPCRLPELLQNSGHLWQRWISPTVVSCPVVPKAGRPIRLTKEQHEFVEEIKERVRAGLDKRTGIITISAQMPDPQVAAQVAQTAASYLKTYVESYRTEKARKDEIFLQQRVVMAGHRYRTAELRWSTYRDTHRHIVLQVADTQGRRLEAEYAFSQTLYTELNRQLEQAKIQVQEERPVFTVLEPAQVPPKHSKPRRLLLIVGFALQGSLAGLILVLARKAVG